MAYLEHPFLLTEHQTIVAGNGAILGIRVSVCGVHSFAPKTVPVVTRLATDVNVSGDCFDFSSHANHIGSERDVFA
jgi:hypothetical protein